MANYPQAFHSVGYMSLTLPTNIKYPRDIIVSEQFVAPTLRELWIYEGLDTSGAFFHAMWALTWKNLSLGKAIIWCQRVSITKFQKNIKLYRKLANILPHHQSRRRMNTNMNNEKNSPASTIHNHHIKITTMIHNLRNRQIPPQLDV
jgi:hypothetical protein